MKSKLLFGYFMLLSSITWAGKFNKNKELWKTVYKINEIRKSAGLDTVILSKKLSNNCYKHISYIKANKNNPYLIGSKYHNEDKTFKRYSKKGEIAAKNSVINLQYSPTVLIDNWENSYYHRFLILQPDLVEVGVAYKKKSKKNISYTLIDCITGKKLSNKSFQTITYPSNNQRDFLIDLFNEVPHPISKDTKAGNPVSILLPSSIKIKDESIDVVLINKTTEEQLACIVVYPKSENVYPIKWNSIGIIPKNILDKNTHYYIEITYETNDGMIKKEINFYTIK